jgi:NAD(P)H-hydrate epimerase
MIDQAQRLYTAAQVRRLDQAVIHGTVQPPAIAGIDLMERAGRAVFEAAVQGWPQARRWLVLCGAGNNGGDGYIVARLASEAGRDVTVCALKDPAALAGDAATAAQRWHAAGGQVLSWPLPGIGKPDLIIDALFGTGLDRAPAGAWAEAIEAVNRLGPGRGRYPVRPARRHRRGPRLRGARGPHRDLHRQQARPVYRGRPGPCGDRSVC